MNVIASTIKADSSIEENGDRKHPSDTASELGVQLIMAYYTNCTDSLPDGAKFCPACGQSTQVFARPWTEAFLEILDNVFDLDGRMLVSLRLLVTRPGLLPYEYTRGRRVVHTSPLRMYLLISLLFFFLLPMTPSRGSRGRSGALFLT